MPENNIIYVTQEELEADKAKILEKYPWFPEHPIDCHAKCARWDIAAEHGYDAGDAWQQYHSILFLLGED